MLRKEFREIIKPTLIVMFVLLLFLLLYKIFPGFLGKGILNISKSVGISQSLDLYLIALFITIEAGGLGSGMFKSEYRDDAFEYLFSSPTSLLKVLSSKIIPRLIVLVIFLSIYLLAFFSHINNEIIHIQSHSIFIKPEFFILWTFFIFFISLFPSIFKQKNWIAITSLFTLLSIFVIPVALKKLLLISDFQLANENNTKMLCFLVGMVIVFLISVIAFLFSHKNYDLKESFFDGKKYSLISLTPQMILITISIFIFIK